jgi:hypothetical protein
MSDKWEEHLTPDIKKTFTILEATTATLDTQTIY